MTTELLYTLLRYGSLILIWVLISSAVLFMKRDIKLSAGDFRYRKSRRGTTQNSNRVGSGVKKQSGARPPRYLAFTGGAIQNKRLALTMSPIIIGRSPDCTVPITDTYASGHHLRFYKRDNQWFVEDLKSTNGTLLNGAKLQTSTPLNIGDRVQIGQTTMELTR